MGFLEELLERMKLRRSIDYVEALPRNPNGKRYKRRQWDPYWEDQEKKSSD